MQYTVQKIVCPQDHMHTEIFPNIDLKAQLIQGVSCLFKAKVLSNNMKIFFEYQDKMADISVYLSYSNKMPSQESNTYSTKNPAKIDVIRPMNPAFTHVYICILSETDTNVMLKLINRKVMQSVEKIEGKSTQFKAKIFEKVATILDDEQKYHEFKEQIEQIKKK